MKKDYNLNEIGIENPVNLHGSVKKIRIENDAPVVFLLDEHHGNVNDCIIKNIENAKTLISDCNVVLIGVESLAGGKEWDEETKEYATDNLNEKYYKEVIVKGWKSNCTTFYDELSKEYSHLIIGVESVGMMNKIEVDIYNQNPQDQSSAIQSHTLTRLRSKHFIQTIFDYYTATQLTGNIILNCGSEHNSHIQEWVRNGEIDQIIGLKATFISLNTF